MDFSSWMLGVFGFCFMTDDELIQRKPTIPHTACPTLQGTQLGQISGDETDRFGCWERAALCRRVSAI